MPFHLTVLSTFRDLFFSRFKKFFCFFLLLSSTDKKFYATSRSIVFAAVLADRSGFICAHSQLDATLKEMHKLEQTHKKHAQDFFSRSDIEIAFFRLQNISRLMM